MRSDSSFTAATSADRAGDRAKRAATTAERADDLRADLLAKRGVTPDAFQLKAFGAIDRGNSVLVAAPTSSGKTLVAEYATALGLAAGYRVAYTSPIKALSNQKLRDLRTSQEHRVGLLTGDNVIEPDAPALVMTTEVLRNMIYSGAPTLAQLGVVVLDEVHYLQDPYRGPVWEEVIIGLPQHVRLVCLSATVTNATELGDWISSVREDTCEVVVETERPVELHEHFLVFDKGSRQIRDFPTLRGTHPNSDVQRFLQHAQRSRHRSGGRAGGRPGGRPGNRSNSRPNNRSNGGAPNGANERVQPARPHRLEILSHLSEQNRLPAIVFVFSRQGCDDAVRECVDKNLHLIDPVSQRRIVEIADEHVADISAADLRSLHYHRWLEDLQSGVAAHHAGMVPPFKEIVEDCFAAGLLAAVFATETLAMGLNMPARSVVVEQLSRFRGEGFVTLTPGEYTQLTGRAGRRGIDEVGHAHTLWSPYESFEQTAELVASADYEIDSSFRPTFNMAANLINTCDDRDAAVELLSKSFAQFRADSRMPEWSEELTVRKEDLKHARRRLRQVSGGKKQSHHRETRAVRDARREFELCEARADLLQGRIALAHGGLARTFDLVAELLEHFGCVDDWQLTDSGTQLSRMFHEADLAIVLALRAGLFDNQEPAVLAGLVSCITYEHHSRTDPPTPIFPSADVRDVVTAIEGIGDEVNRQERAFGLTQTRQGSSAFFECAYVWGSGASLEEILVGDEFGNGPRLGQQLSPGDFVRQIRNLADLVRQIMIVAHKSDTRNSAREALGALDRGVVAAATGLAGGGSANSGSSDIAPDSPAAPDTPAASDTPPAPARK